MTYFFDSVTEGHRRQDSTGYWNVLKIELKDAIQGIPNRVIELHRASSVYSFRQSNAKHGLIEKLRVIRFDRNVMVCHRTK